MPDEIDLTRESELAGEPLPAVAAAAGHSSDPDRRSAAISVRGARTAFSDYASVVGARGLSAVVAIGSVTLSTRVFAPKGYGILAYFNVVALLMFNITSSWLSSSVARYGREELERVGHMRAVTTARWRISRYLVCAALVVVPATKLAGGFPPEFSWTYTALAAAMGIVLIATDHVLYLLDAAGRMKLSALAGISQQLLLVFALVVIFATGWTRSPAVMAGLSLLTGLGTLAVFGSRVHTLGLWPPLRDGALERRMRTYSYPLIAYVGSQYAIRTIDIIVIRSFQTIVAVGLYAVAYQAYSVIQQAATASGQVLTPLFVSLTQHGHEHVIRRYLERVVPQLTFVWAFALGLIAPVAYSMVPVVFSAKFGAAATPLVVLLVAVSLVFASNLLAPIVVLHERTRAVALINVLAAVINVIGDVITIGLLHTGIVGPAIATTLALVAITIGYYEVSRRCTGSTAAPNFVVVLPAVAGVAAALIFSGVPRLLAGPGLTVLVALAVARTTQVFKRDDAELVARLDMPHRLQSAVGVLIRVMAR